MVIHSQWTSVFHIFTHLASNTVGTLQRDAPLLISSRQITLSKNGDTFSLISRRYVRDKIIKEPLKRFERMEKYGLKPQILPR